MATKEHIVIKNEHTAYLATQVGYQNWRTLWDANPELSGKRKHPLILFHGDKAVPTGDIIQLPDLQKKQEPGATNSHHSFEIGQDTVFLRLRVLDEELQAIANASYELVVNGKTYPEDGPGAFEPGGMINVEVPKTAQSGKLYVRFQAAASNANSNGTVDVIEGNRGSNGSAASSASGTQLIRRNGQLCPHYCQSDSRWGGRILGDDDTISSAGCALTSAAMCLAYYGRSVNPGDLDQYVDDHGGYNGDSIKSWDVVFQCGETSGSAKVRHAGRIESSGQFNSVLDDRISKNLPTIAAVGYGSSSSIAHFVVIVGKSSDGYIMNDPGQTNGNGAAYPAATNTILEKTTRNGGYKLLRLDLCDTDEAVNPGTPSNPGTNPPSNPSQPPPDDPDEQPPADGEWVEVTFNLEIGKLNPIREQAPDTNCFAGVQQRLNNLGFDAGPVDGLDGTVTQNALKRFQRYFKLPATGKPDPPTQQKLYEMHDQPGTDQREEEPDDTQNPGNQNPSNPSPPAEDPATSPGQPTSDANAPPNEIPVYVPTGTGVTEEQLYDAYRSIILGVGTFCDEPGRYNLLGIRKLQQPERQVVANAWDLYNDTIAVIWKDSGGTKRVKEYKASCDPGEHSSTSHKDGEYANSDGLAHLCDGQWQYTTGYHKSTYPCLKQAENVIIWRSKFRADGNADNVYDSDETTSVGNYGINIHAAGTGTTVDNWSAGCQVIWGDKGAGTPYAEIMGPGTTASATHGGYMGEHFASHSTINYTLVTAYETVA